jgi:hypothetical protein
VSTNEMSARQQNISRRVCSSVKSPRAYSSPILTVLTVLTVLTGRTFY